MIFAPKVGQDVRIWYGASHRDWMPYHGLPAVVVATARGRGPRNVVVKVESKLVCVPRGNLVHR